MDAKGTADFSYDVLLKYECVCRHADDVIVVDDGGRDAAGGVDFDGRRKRRRRTGSGEE